MLIYRNMPERGRAGTGAVLSLSAIGKQDTYLTSNTEPENSFFHFKNKQYTNSSLYYHPHIVSTQDPSNTQSWPFGRTIRFDINPKTSGDLLANAWLKLELPPLLDSNSYAPYVGHTLIKEARFSINGVTIDREVSEWMVCHHELFLNQSGSRATHNLVGPEEVTSDAGGMALIIPLYFFFCRDTSTLYRHTKGFENLINKPYFYLCACPEQEITITIDFQPVPYFSNANPTTSVFCNKLNLITQEYSLTDQERNYYLTQRQLSLINVVGVQSPLPINKGDNSFKNFLSSRYPVKAFHWFLRNTEVENTSNSFYFDQRYNFSSNLLSSDCTLETSNVIMSDAKIHIDGAEQIGFQGPLNNTEIIGGVYYKFLQPYQHHLTVPCRNIYTYSFSINEYDPIPSGGTNFSILKYSNTYLTGGIYQPVVEKNQEFNLYLYYVQSAILEYKNGSCSLVFA